MVRADPDYHGLVDDHRQPRTLPAADGDGARSRPGAGDTFDGRPGVPDRFGRALRDLRISVTDRCNFRCPYCMPAEVFGRDFAFLPRELVLSFEEIARLAAIFVGLGVHKLRITGGEPLVRRDLPVLVSQLAALPSGDGQPVDLTLTTNGSALRTLAAPLADAGLQRITVSLDSLDDAVFGAMNGVDFPVSRVLEGIAAARAAGLAPIKVNTVVRRGMNEASILPLARWAREEGLILRFIEYMDVGHSNGWRLDDVVDAAEILATIDAELPLEPAAPNYRGEVAGRYRFRDGGGEIGVIASVSRPFCGDCTRARLSAEGHLYTCLFAVAGTDLKTPLRAGESDDELEARIRAVWGARDGPLLRAAERGHRAPAEGGDVRPGRVGSCSPRRRRVACRRPTAWRCCGSPATVVHRSSTPGENWWTCQPPRSLVSWTTPLERHRARRYRRPCPKGPMEARNGGDRLKSVPPGRPRSPQGHAGVRSAITSRTDALRSLRALHLPAVAAREGRDPGRPDGRDRHPGVGTPSGR